MTTWRENVDELVSGARQYDLENPEGGLRGYLSDVALVSDVDGFEEQSPRVTLMTLHSSKGLEFPLVFIAGLEEGMLPHVLALEDEPLGGAEEERRLLYVGMTRAMDELTLTHARMRLHFGEASYQVPSRFLAELPSEWTEAPEPGESGSTYDDGPRFVPDEEPEEAAVPAPGARVGIRPGCGSGARSPSGGGDPARFVSAKVLPCSAARVSRGNDGIEQLLASSAPRRRRRARLKAKRRT